MMQGIEVQKLSTCRPHASLLLLYVVFSIQVVISPSLTEQEVIVYGEGNSLMRTSSINITEQDGYVWLMLDQTPMDHSSTSLWSSVHGLMAHTRALGRSCKEWLVTSLCVGLWMFILFLSLLHGGCGTQSM